MFSLLWLHILGFMNNGNGIKYVFPTNSSSAGGEIITIVYEKKLKEKYATCRFDNINVQSVNIREKNITCISPPHPPGEVEFKISFTNSDWMSLQGYEFIYYPTAEEIKDKYTKLGISVLLGAIFLVGLFIILSPRSIINKREGDSAEKQPFLEQN